MTYDTSNCSWQFTGQWKWGLRKQQVMWIIQDPHMLHLIPSFWREQAWIEACLQVTGGGQGKLGVGKQWIKSINWYHYSLGLTSSMWRQAEWSEKSLQCTGEEVKGSEVLENNKWSILTRTWICSVFILHFEAQCRDPPRLLGSYINRSESIIDTIHDREHCSLQFTDKGSWVWGNNTFSEWTKILIYCVWLHGFEGR